MSGGPGGTIPRPGAGAPDDADGLSGAAGQTVYADANTASAGLKQGLAAIADEAGVPFADIALMSPVPGRGLHTPMVVSGPAAEDVARLLGACGATVSVLPGPAGAAATRKLLRSVFYKGMAAAAIEALHAARAAGCEDWLREHIAAELAAADAGTLARLEALEKAWWQSEGLSAGQPCRDPAGALNRLERLSRRWLRSEALVRAKDDESAVPETIVGDTPAELETALREGLRRDLLVVSGGLGPTHDDRTVEPWYRYNTLLYVRESAAPALPDAVSRTRLDPDCPIPGFAPLGWQIRRTLLRPLPVGLVTTLARLKNRLNRSS